MNEFLTVAMSQEWAHSFILLIVGSLISLIGVMMTVIGWLGARTLKTLIDADLALKTSIDEHIASDDAQFSSLFAKIDRLSERNSTEHQSILTLVAGNSMMLSKEDR